VVTQDQISFWGSCKQDILLRRLRHTNYRTYNYLNTKNTAFFSQSVFICPG